MKDAVHVVIGQSSMPMVTTNVENPIVHHMNIEPILERLDALAIKELHIPDCSTEITKIERCVESLRVSLIGEERFVKSAFNKLDDRAVEHNSKIKEVEHTLSVKNEEIKSALYDKILKLRCDTTLQIDKAKDEINQLKVLLWVLIALCGVILCRQFLH